MIQQMPVPVEQVEGEIRAVDLIRAYLIGDADIVARVMDCACGVTRAYMRQQLDGLLHQAVLADSALRLGERFVMGPVGLAWLETVPMSEAVTAAVLSLAGDGSNSSWRQLTEDDSDTALALSAAARMVAAWGIDGALERLAAVRAVVSQP